MERNLVNVVASLLCFPFPWCSNEVVTTDHVDAIVLNNVGSTGKSYVLFLRWVPGNDRPEYLYVADWREAAVVGGTRRSGRGWALDWRENWRRRHVYSPQYVEWSTWHDIEIEDRRWFPMTDRVPLTNLPENSPR